MEGKMKKNVMFLLLLALFVFGCSNSSTNKLQPAEKTDGDTAAEEINDSDSDTGNPADSEQQPDDDTGNAEETAQNDEDLPDDEETELPDSEIPDIDPTEECTNDPLFCYGEYYVNVFDVDAGDNGSPRLFRVYEPIDAEGQIPVVHFLHGFMYKISYYDRFLMHLASHGFIVVSSQSAHKMANGDTTSQEAEKVAAFINWLKENLKNYVAATPDFENFGLSGHSRGGKVTNRILNSDPTIAKSFFGVDPVDSKPPFSGFIGADDPESLSEPVMFTGESMFLGTEKGPSGIGGIGNTGACAPEGNNSVNFYASYPSPSHHIIAAGVGHADMVDPEDIKICSLYCSSCAGSSDDGMKSMFITYTGGLMTAFFNATLKGLAEYEKVINDPSVYPFYTKAVEHK